MSLVCLLVLGLALTVEAGRDFYKILGLERSATSGQIKKAYRSLAKKYHPDSNLDNPAEALVKFEEVTDAYNILFDEEKRVVYDERGEEGLKEENQRGGFNPFTGGFQNQQTNKMESISMILEVSLEDLYTGKEIDIQIQNQKVCNHCRGSGADSPDGLKKCHQCDGGGRVLRRLQVGPGMFQQVQQECPLCSGKGKIVKKKCHVCSGNKVVPGHSHNTLVIEKGMCAGDIVTLAKAGDVRPGMVAADLKYKIYVNPHDTFIRDGDSLTTYLTISLKDALLGFTKTIKHLDGTTFEATRNGVSQPGQVITLEGMGMPKRDYNIDHGPLYVIIQVVNPNHLSDATKEQLANIL